MRSVSVKKEQIKIKKDTKMLDKSKTYTGFTKPYNGRNQSPAKRFNKVIILFEDDVSFYVESMTEKDGAGNGKRYSMKKHCFTLIEHGRRELANECAKCPFKNIIKHILNNPDLKD